MDIAFDSPSPPGRHVSVLSYKDDFNCLASWDLSDGERGVIRHRLGWISLVLNLPVDKREGLGDTSLSAMTVTGFTFDCSPGRIPFMRLGDDERLRAVRELPRLVAL
jgi:hypothetical protein